ncbi:MAG TPA: hypothetical protein VI298_08595 [Geobacteraceae bacterium]
MKKNGRIHYAFTPEQDARIMAAYERKTELIKDLAVEFGLANSTVKIRYERLVEARAQIFSGPVRVEGRPAPKDEQILFRRRMPAWLLPPVDKAVENPATF